MRIKDRCCSIIPDYIALIAWIEKKFYSPLKVLQDMGVVSQQLYVGSIYKQMSKHSKELLCLLSPDWDLLNVKDINLNIKDLACFISISFFCY